MTAGRSTMRPPASRGRGPRAASPDGADLLSYCRTSLITADLPDLSILPFMNAVPGRDDRLELLLPSPIEELRDARISPAGVRVHLKRDDLVNPDIPGNKWRKLKYNVQAAREARKPAILTFGGAYSNHIRATAAAGTYFGFRTIGVIRGEEHLPLNSTLRYAVNHGMQITYVDRARYRQKTDSALIAELRDQFGDFYLIPEGGGNAAGVRGCGEIVDEITLPYNVICCSCGTAATLAGISLALPQGRRALGFAALKGAAFLKDDVRRMQNDLTGRVAPNWDIVLDYHFGGFAKKKPHLMEFIEDFRERHGILLDRVYEAKMMYGLIDMVRQGRFRPGTEIVAVIAGPAEPC